MTKPIQKFFKSYDYGIFKQMIEKYGWILATQFKNFGIYRNINYSIDLILPINNELKDSTKALKDLLNQISEIYQKPIQDIVNEYNNEKRNKVKLRIIGEELDGGVIPFNQGIKLLENTKEMIVSSYLATSFKKKNFLGSRPDNINRHLEKVELGQTEVRSYIINVFLPAENEEENLIAEEPLSSKALKQLETATDSLKDSISKFSITNDYSEFEGLEKRGVSSNLCFAINEIGNDGKNDININLEYDSSLDEIPLVKEIYFKKEDIRIIKNVGLLYKQDLTEPDFNIIGYVIDLHREKDQMEGDITISTKIDKKKKNVRIHLQFFNYQEAVKAHETSKQILVRGTLVTKINRTYMNNVSKVEIISENDNDDNTLF